MYRHRGRMCYWLTHVHPDTSRLPWYTSPHRCWAGRPEPYHYRPSHRRQSALHRLAWHLVLHTSPLSPGASHLKQTKLLCLLTLHWQVRSRGQPGHLLEELIKKGSRDQKTNEAEVYEG